MQTNREGKKSYKLTRQNKHIDIQTAKREASECNSETGHQLFMVGNLKLPWIRQTAGSSPEKRENELG